jgi:hypothetical protein
VNAKVGSMGDENANGSLLWKSFCSPRTIEANYLFGAMSSNARLYQGAGIKKSNEAGKNLPRKPWTNRLREYSGN